MLRQISLSVVFAVGFVSVAPAWGQTASPLAARSDQDTAPAFREKLIGEITPGSSFRDIRLSGEHIAWAEESTGKRTVRLDGNPQGGVYDDVKYMKFNADATHFVFFGKRGSSWIFVLDGHEQPQAYEKFSGVSFQPGGSSYAFFECQEKKCRLNVNGTETGAVYENFSYPLYSRDGTRLAFFGKRGEKWIAVVDGKEMVPELDEFSGAAWGFTRDDKRFYAAGRLNGKWTYVVDGVPGPGFDAVSRIAISPDCQHFAYAGTYVRGGALKKKTIGTMIVDGKAGETHEGSGMAGSLSLIGGSWQYMIGGVHDMGADFSGVSTPWYNSAGKLAYSVRRKVYDVAVLVGGEAGPGFEEILSPVVFSQDAAHFAYIAKHDGEFLEVRDHQVRQTLALSKTKNRTTGVPWILMSPDGAHLAYEIVSGGEQFQQGSTERALRSMIMDGKAGPEYDVLGLENFDFAKNGGHFHYEVHGAKGTRDLVNVDGHESRLYDFVWATQFSNDEKNVTFVALDDKRLFRVTYPLE